MEQKKDFIQNNYNELLLKACELGADSIPQELLFLYKYRKEEVLSKLSNPNFNNKNSPSFAQYVA